MGASSNTGRRSAGFRHQNGAGTRNRTPDLPLTRRLLYQLSYAGCFPFWLGLYSSIDNGVTPAGHAFSPEYPVRRDPDIAEARYRVTDRLDRQPVLDA